MAATHIITTVQAVDFAKIARDSAKEKEELELLDWSLSLLIESTNFGFEMLLQQLDQARRLNCTESEYKIEKLLNEKYSFSYKAHLEECKPDNSSADGSDER